MKTRTKTIKDVLAELGIDQKQLARECRVSESQISYIVNGKRNPSMDLVARLAFVLELGGGELFEMLQAEKERRKKRC